MGMRGHSGCDDASADSDTKIVCAAGIEPDCFQLKSESGFVKEKLDQESHEDSDEDPEGNLAADSADLYIGQSQAGIWGTDAAGPGHHIHEIVIDKEAGQITDDVIDHDRGYDFMDIEAVFEKTNEGSEKSARE